VKNAHGAASVCDCSCNAIPSIPLMMSTILLALALISPIMVTTYGHDVAHHPAALECHIPRLRGKVVCLLCIVGVVLDRLGQRCH
jgi:hypothetical protein